MLEPNGPLEQRLAGKHVAHQRDDLRAVQFDRVHHVLVWQSTVAVFHSKPCRAESFYGVGDLAGHRLR